MLQGLFTMEKCKGASSGRTSSSNIVSGNEDLMVDILSRLPVKALSRFKCVSKQWNMLITDPFFVSSHQARAIPDPNIIKLLWVARQDGLIGLCSIKEREERIVTVDFILPNYTTVFFPQGGFVMKGDPCNGLICLVAWDGHVYQTLVCNPTTGNSMILPIGNERKSNYVEGLGYCSSSNEFKVVRLFERSELDMSIRRYCKWYGCELFTIGQRAAQGTNLLQHSSTWRQVGNLPHRIVDPSCKSMCFANGSVHWMIEQFDPVSSSSSNFILSLDLELEEFKVIAQPESWAHDNNMNMYDKELGGDRRYDLMDICLKELGGKLCVVCKVVDCKQWDIWVLKDYTNSIWTNDYCIDLEDSFYPNNVQFFSAVALWRGQILIDINFDRILHYYDPRTGFFEEVFKLGMIGKLGTYAESLAAPF